MNRVLFPAVIGGLLFAADSLAQTDRNARDLAASCTACHSVSAGSAPGAIPALAGKDRDALIAAMQGFKEGKRPGTVMPQLAKALTDGEVAAISGWFAQRGAEAR